MDIKMPDYYLKNVNIALKKTIKNIVENGNSKKKKKGAIITPAKLNKFKDLYLHYMNFFANYPDYFIKLITPSNIKFKLFAYQVYFLRLCLRYARVFIIACRAFSKSFISILALYLMCIFRPGIKLFICAKKLLHLLIEKLTANFFKSWNLLNGIISFILLFNDYSLKEVRTNVLKKEMPFLVMI